MKASTFLATILLSLATVAAEADDKKATHPFNGKNLDGWTTKQPAERSQWRVGVATMSEQNPSELTVGEVRDGDTPELVNASGRGVDIYTTENYGDLRITLELMVPKGSNSGVYVMGEYEVQVFDSFGKESVGPGDIGGLYGAAAPRSNAAKAPGEWQSLEIVFRGPKFDGEKKTSNAMFEKVILNGTVIHESVEMKGPTPSGVTGKESATGPIMFQGDHGPVTYRNISIEPLD